MGQGAGQGFNAGQGGTDPNGARGWGQGPNARPMPPPGRGGAGGGGGWAPSPGTPGAGGQWIPGRVGEQVWESNLGPSTGPSRLTEDPRLAHTLGGPGNQPGNFGTGYTGNIRTGAPQPNPFVMQAPPQNGVMGGQLPPGQPGQSGPPSQGGPGFGTSQLGGAGGVPVQNQGAPAIPGQMKPAYRAPQAGSPAQSRKWQQQPGTTPQGPGASPMAAMRQMTGVSAAPGAGAQNVAGGGMAANPTRRQGLMGLINKARIPGR